jgi:hypothetical protein
MPGRGGFAQGAGGSHVRVTQDRVQPIESELADFVTTTFHPSSILRVGDRRHEELEAFVRDPTKAANEKV